MKESEFSDQGIRKHDLVIVGSTLRFPFCLTVTKRRDVAGAQPVERPQFPSPFLTHGPG
jgi:hypothetical protein